MSTTPWISSWDLDRMLDLIHRPDQLTQPLQRENSHAARKDRTAAATAS